MARAGVLCVSAAVLAGAVAAAAAVGSSSAQHPALGCPIFPSNNPWNQRVDHLPVARGSGVVVRRVGAQKPLHPDFGSGQYRGQPIGIPYVIVPGDQPKVPVDFRYRHESDPGPYPIPPDAPIQGGPRSREDRHVLVIDRGACRVYEVYAAYPVDSGRSWRAGSGAIWNLRSNRLRPKGWTSADAAGLPIFPGLVRYEEVEQGRIDHALRMTVPRTRRAFRYPARHFASTSTDPALPPMGLRFRLKANVDVSSFSDQPRAVLLALKRYGAFVADNGGAWYVTGAPSPEWDNNDLHELHRISGSDFEAVDTRPLPRPGG